MSGLILRLAGPLQSWGSHSSFNARDTEFFPTRSGLVGMFNATRGLPRTADLSDYRDLHLTVRIDRPGRHLVDFHTVGGGAGDRRDTVPTGEGGRRPLEAATLVTRRGYLSDAVFVVAVRGPDPLLDTLRASLARPVWAPYLGRRSCPPDEPLVLRADVDDPEHEVLNRVPLSIRPPGSADEATIDVTVLWDGPPTGNPGAVPTYQINDQPSSFATHTRRYVPRPIWRTVEKLPARLAARSSADGDILTYAQQET